MKGMNATAFGMSPIIITMKKHLIQGLRKGSAPAIYVKKSLKTIQEQADAALALTKKDQPLSLDFDFDGF